MAVTLAIKVVPSSGRQAWKLDKSGVLKCYLKNPPEKNKANSELVRFLADSLDISTLDVALVGGLTDRKKFVKITIDLSQQAVIDALLAWHS